MESNGLEKFRDLCPARRLSAIEHGMHNKAAAGLDVITPVLPSLILLLGDTFGMPF